MKKILFFFIAALLTTTVFSQKLIPFDKSLYKSGLKDSNGKVIIKPRYTGIKDNKTHFELYKNTEGTTIMTYDGKVLIPPTYREVEITLNKKYYKVKGFKTEYSAMVMGYIDLQGNEVIPVKYHHIEDYYGYKYLEVSSKYNQYGLISTGNVPNTISDYKEIVPPIYSDVKYKTLKDGRVAILVRDIHNRIASLDSNGNIVTDFVNWFLPLKFIDTEVWIAEDRDTKKHALVDAFLKPITPFEYDDIYHDKTNKDQYIIYKGKNVGVMDKTGKIIIEPKYQTLANKDCSMIPAKLGNKWGILDIKGKVVLPFEYDDIGDCSVFEIDLLKDNKWQRIDIYTKKVKSDVEVYENVVATFEGLSKKIIKDIDDFAYEQNSIQKTKYTTETELQKRYKELLNTKVYDLKLSIRKATNILENFLKQYPSMNETEKKHLKDVINEYNRTWNYLDKAQNYTDTIFTIKEETVEGVIDDILKKYEKK